MNSLTRGLLNLGSTCFLNAALQVLCRCDKFTEKLELLAKDENDASGLATILNDTFKQMTTEPISNPLEPLSIHKWILENTKQFPAGIEGDPLELIEILIDCLDYMDFSHFEEVSVRCSRQHHDIAEEYQPVDPFGVGLKFQLKPTDTTPTSTKELLQKYFLHKTGRECRYCEGDEMLKKRIFMDPPKTLIISIGRNCNSVNGDYKNSVACSADTLLSVPMENQIPVKYKLIAAIEHEGTRTTSGHFKAIVKDNNMWYCYSDDEITMADINPKNVYIVVYNQIEIGSCQNLAAEGNNKGNHDQTDFCVPMFSVNEVEDAQLEMNAEETNVNDNDGVVNEFNKRYVEKYKYYGFYDNRLLIMCIPKQIEGNSFNEKYQNFLKSKLVVLYAITSRHQTMYTKLRKDPFIKQHFDVFKKSISSKLGVYHTRKWIGQAATAFIIHSLLYNDGPRFEFMFELRVNSLIPASIIAYWDSCKSSTLEAMERIVKGNLFCLYTCNHKCNKTKDPFHFSLKGMQKVDFLTETDPVSTIERWSFIDNLNEIEGHPLESLLSPIKIDPNVSIATQVSVKLNECDFLQTRKVNVYLLMIVNDAPDHTIQDLKELWQGTAATFAVYAGCTCDGRYRKDHLRTTEEGGISSVSKFLNSSSKVYLVLSQEFDQRKDAEEAEAKIIAVLKYHALKEIKTGLTHRFTVLNVNNSFIPLYNSYEKHNEEIQEFIRTGERLFVFHGETYLCENEDRILKCHLVDEVVR